MFDVHKRPFLAGLTFGLLHAIAYTLAFPPLNLAALAPLSLVPLTMLALRTSRPGRSALAAGIASIPMWGFHHQFIWKMSEAGLFPLVAYLSLYPGLYVWLLARAHKALPRLSLVVLVPIVWTGLEMLRGEILWDGFAWYLMPLPLVGWHAVSGWASVVGVYGVSFGVAAAIGWCFEARRWSRESKDAPGHAARSSLLSASGAMLAIALVIGSGSLSPGPRPPARTVRVAAIQTNIPQDNRSAWTIDDRVRDFERFVELTRAAAAASPRPDLIAWPETMFPGSALNAQAVDVERDAKLAYRGTLHTTVFYDRLLALQAEIDIPMVVGAKAEEGLRIETGADGSVQVESDASFNSAFVLEDGAVLSERYDKMRLTPFGEVMPYISRWEWLEQRLLALGGRGMTFALEAGTTPTRPSITLEARGKDEAMPLRLALPICFEVSSEDVCRALVTQDGRRRADLFVSISNDGWYDWFDAGREHLMLLARWRCIENRTPMLRCANTGYTAAIDAFGRLVQLGPNVEAPGLTPLGERVGKKSTNIDGVLVAELDLPPADGASVYARFGNAMGWMSLAALLTVTFLTLTRKGVGSGPGQPTTDAPTPPGPTSDGAGPRLRLTEPGIGGGANTASVNPGGANSGGAAGE